MPTATERMLDLSPLASPNLASVHFLAITEGTGASGEPTGETIYVTEVIEVSNDGLELLGLDTVYLTTTLQLIANNTPALELQTSSSGGLELEAPAADDDLGLTSDGRSNIALREC